MCRLSFVRFAGLLFLSASAVAQFTIGGDNADNKGPVVPVTSVTLDSQPMSKRTRLEMIRVMEAEFAFTRIPLPAGDKGLTLKANGPLSPSGFEFNDTITRQGEVAKMGQKIQITAVVIRDHDIRFEINGGPRGKEKWYQHIQVGGNGGWNQVGPNPGAAPHGALLTLAFDKFVPEMNPDQLRGLLAPIFDFSLKSPTQAYADSLPPKTKAAVIAHKALVGMTREMVLNSRGVPRQKVRETDNGVAYEEWIYGEPPAEVEFVRFVGDEVVRIETLPFGEAAVIRTEREVDTPVKVAEAKPPQSGDDQAQGSSTAKPAKAPTMRRPGEGVPDANEQPGNVGTETRTIGMPQQQPYPGGGPMETPLPGPPLAPDPGSPSGPTQGTGQAPPR